MTDYTSAEFWKGAPEGATHYCAAQIFKGANYGEHWLKPGFYCVPGCGSWVEDECRVPDDILVCRPSASWSGEGLPPVGIICRIPDDMAGGNGFLAQFEGLTVEIVAHSISSRGNPVAVFSYTGTDGESRFHALADNPNYPNFEPIKPSAQIAAEEREAAIQKILMATNPVGHIPGYTYQLVNCLYDAGLRFPKGDDK